MPWVRIDEEFVQHPKVVQVGPFGVALQVAALCYANRHLTDGFIPAGAVRLLLDFNRLGENVGDRVEQDFWQEVGAFNIAERLVEAGMWRKVSGGFQIHDYEHYQPTRAQVLAERERNAVAGKRSAQARATRRQHPVEPPVEHVVDASLNGNPTQGQPVPVPVTVTQEQVNTIVEQARPADPTDAVFDAWKDSTGKARAQLDDKRRRKIKAALRAYPITDVLDAVRGWAHSPHHRGENEQGTVYNELTLLLRDAEHIERFRDFWRAGPPNGPPGKATLRMVRTAQQMHQWAQRMEGGEDAAQPVDPGRGTAQRELPGPAG
jgi:hypothetical protein